MQDSRKKDLLLIKRKLHRLNGFLNRASLNRASSEVTEMIYSLNKKSASDETVALTPNRVWKSYSEPILVEEGLKPIRFIAGTESEGRGSAL